MPHPLLRVIAAAATVSAGPAAPAAAAAPADPTNAANPLGPSSDWAPATQGQGVPGSSTLQALARDLEWWGLALALVGLVVGAAVWALGSHSQNFHQAVTGRRAVLACGLAALLIGAGPTIINFFFNAGSGVTLPTS